MPVCMYVCMCVCGDVAVVFRTDEEFSFLTSIFQTNNTGWKNSTPCKMGEKKEYFLTYVHMYVCRKGCSYMYVCTYVCVHLCMYVYLCMCLCMYVCMYVCI